VDPVPGSSIVCKDRFDIWQSQKFVTLLEAWGIEGLIIAGVELRCCVLFAVLGADERGYRCVVPHDLVSGQDHDQALMAIRQYLTIVYSAPPTAGGILDGWSTRADQSRE
jgi:nicotinamidase-related amidase